MALCQMITPIGKADLKYADPNRVGTYPGYRFTYRKDGQEYAWQGHVNSLKYKPDILNVLRSIYAGEWFEFEEGPSPSNPKYKEIVHVSKTGYTAQQMESAVPATASDVSHNLVPTNNIFNNSTSAAASPSGYVMNERETTIVYQNALGHAVNITKEGLSEDAVCKIAENIVQRIQQYLSKYKG